MKLDVSVLLKELSKSRIVADTQKAPSLDALGVTKKSVCSIGEWSRAMASYGILASYIPELKKVNKDLTAIAVGDTLGNKVVIGDGSKIKISAQSVIKPFLYLYALESGAPAKSISGIEPTAMPFNTDRILRPELQMKVPDHPLNNAGAISSAGEIKDFSDFIAFMKKATGNLNLGVLENVFESEFKSNNNNRAIASRLVASGRFKSAKEGEEAYANYTKACSLGLTVGEVLNAAVSLSTGGLSVPEGKRIAKTGNVIRVLSAMNTYGLYEQSGLFSLMVSGSRANTAKSGVSGLIINVNPGVGAFVTYSPLLNLEGNSVYGLYAMIPLNDLLALPGGMRLEEDDLNSMLVEYHREERMKVHAEIALLIHRKENPSVFRADSKILRKLGKK